MSFTLNILSGPKKSRHTFDESSLYLFGSNQSLSETGKRFIEETNNDVLILSNLQIFGDFLKYMAAPNNITISESCHDLIVYKSMQNSELKYFDKMKHWPAIKNEFAKAISKIKRNCISSTELCKMLEKGGSDKENDLLRVYTKYEQIQSELNFLDPADLYIQAIQNLNNRTCEVLTKFDSIYFDLSIKLDYDILNLIKEINNNYENIKIEIDTLNKHDSEIIEAFGKISDIKIHNCGDVNTSNISHYALPTPEQELNYIVDSIISLVNSGTDPQQIGILLRKPHSLFSRIALLLSDRGLGQGAFKDNHLILKKLSQHIMSQITDFKKEGTITEYCKFINKLTDDYIKKASLTEKFNVTTLSIPAIKEIKGINDWNDIINKLTFADELGEIGKIKVNHFLEILEDELSHKPIYYENFRTPIKFYTFEDAPTIDVKHLFIPNFDSDNYPRITSVGYFFNEPDLFDNPYQSTLNHFKTAPENDFNVELSLFNWILMNQKPKITLTISSYNSLGNELSASPLSYNIQEPEYISSYKPN
ncbi:hypothetical protein L6250_00865 [Candidatus Parcubacteria bacterium]|nr:hypothetical protein [Candidatus Parcubacteria bacterium]